MNVNRIAKINPSRIVTAVGNLWYASCHRKNVASYKMPNNYMYIPATKWKCDDSNGDKSFVVR